jgi:hypothetical protein
MPFIYGIADLHGRYDLLSEAVTKIVEHSKSDRPATIITLGDYVDRGPNSRQVIQIYSMAPSFVNSRVATIAAYTSCVIATPSLSRRANNSKISSLSAFISILRRISSGNFTGSSYQNTLCLMHGFRAA